MAKPDPYLTFFLARDLFRKPVPTFRDHALARMTGQWVMRRVASTLSRGLRPDPKTKGSARRRSLYRRTLRPLLLSLLVMPVPVHFRRLVVAGNETDAAI